MSSFTNYFIRVWLVPYADDSSFCDTRPRGLWQQHHVFHIQRARCSYCCANELSPHADAPPLCHFPNNCSGVNIISFCGGGKQASDLELCWQTHLTLKKKIERGFTSPDASCILKCSFNSRLGVFPGLVPHALKGKCSSSDGWKLLFALPLCPPPTPPPPGLWRVNTPLVEAKRGTSTRRALTFLRRRNPPPSWSIMHNSRAASSISPPPPPAPPSEPVQSQAASDQRSMGRRDRSLTPPVAFVLAAPLGLRRRRRSVCSLEGPTATDQSHSDVTLTAQRGRGGIVSSLHFHKSCQCGWTWDHSFGFLVAPPPQRVPSVLYSSYIIACFRSLPFISVSSGAALHYHNPCWIKREIYPSIRSLLRKKKIKCICYFV